MSIHNSYCKACGEGILTQQNRIREIPYKDTILKVKENSEQQLVYLESEINVLNKIRSQV